MQYMKASRFFYLVLIMLPACYKPKSVPFFSKSQPVEDKGVHSVQLEAYLHDIAIPFHQGKPMLLSSSSQAPETIIMEYQLALDTQVLINIITQEMDRLGWQSVMSVSSAEALLVYKKPKRRAAFYVSPLPTTIRLVLFLSQEATTATN